MQSKNVFFYPNFRNKMSCLYVPVSVLQPYSKSKIELKLNLSEILTVNCKFIRDSHPI